MHTSKGFVSIGHLVLSAVVGLGGIGAVISFVHNSDLLDSIHIPARATAALEVHANDTSPTDTPQQPQTAASVSIEDSVQPTITPIPSDTPFSVNIHPIIRRGDDDDSERENDERQTNQHSDVQTLPQEQTQASLSVTRGSQ